MNARMDHPIKIIPGAFDALLALGKAGARGGLPQTTINLVLLRASQINGCSVCALMHASDARKAGETDERLATVAPWRDAPFFSEAERAALSLTEAVTRLSDRPDPVPDAIFDEAARHYDQRALAALLITIANINVWNRLNVATRQVAGVSGG